MKPTIIDYDPQELVPTQPQPEPTLTIKDYLRDAEQLMASTGVCSGVIGGGGYGGGATWSPPIAVGAPMSSPVASDDLIVFHYEPYPGAAAVPGVRQVRPDKVAKGSDLSPGLNSDDWYLTGTDIKSGNHRTYRLDRMWSASCPPGGRADAPVRELGPSASALWEHVSVAGLEPIPPWQLEIMDKLAAIDRANKKDEFKKWHETSWELDPYSSSPPVRRSSSKP